MTKRLSSNCLSIKNIGETVLVQGWVNKRRDHGGVIFIDCRDYNGIIQLVFNPETEIFKLAESIRSEYVIRVTGNVRARPEGTVNSELTSGEIEIDVQSLEIINSAKALPFHIADAIDAKEDVRLLYRFLDLRRPEMQQRLRFRAKLTTEVHKFLAEQGFTDVETPVLTKATPEGARDYLVPSRTHLGHCFALPQSPQIFKQLLMMSGVEKYYQIVKCFRDEDLRADRQPEFTQIDLEMAFVEQQDVMNLVENLCRHMFKVMLGVEFPEQLNCLTYSESMTQYGTDRPDLRNPLHLVDVDSIFQESGFAVFAGAAKDHLSRIAAMRVPGGASLSRKQIDHYTKLVSQAGAKGLAYIKVNDLSDLTNGLQSPLTKFFSEQELTELLKITQVENGDILFFGAGKKDIVASTMSLLRDNLGADLNLIDEKAWSLLWVVDFPMFEVEYSDSGTVINLNPMHHPFTSPSCSMSEFNTAPETAKSNAYDLVLNGCEIGGGSIRIHDLTMQEAVLAKIGIQPEQAKVAFGHLLRGLEYGCPPHGGFAFGLDRLLMLMTGAKSIRDVMAFPKTQSAACPLTDAPTRVESKQLSDLGIEVIELPQTEE